MSTTLRMPTLYADGHEVRAERYEGNQWRVFAGKTFIGGIERRDETDWRLSVVFVPDEQLGSVLKAVPETHNGPFDVASDAAQCLAEAFGLTVERRQVDFRVVVEADIDLTAERKAELLAMCDRHDNALPIAGGGSLR